MTRRADDEHRSERSTAIEECPRCDEWGWCLGADGLAADTARRCGHNTAEPRAVRDVTEPLHERLDVP